MSEHSLAHRTKLLNLTFVSLLELNSHLSGLIWTVMLLSLASMFTVPRPSGIRTFAGSIILRMIFSIGPSPTIWLLGFITVILKGVHIVSLMGNSGTLEKHVLKIVTDVQLIYHCGYMMFCMAGMLVHPFFYSVLVRNIPKTYYSSSNAFHILLINSFCFSAFRCRLPRRNITECDTFGNTKR